MRPFHKHLIRGWSFRLIGTACLVLLVSQWAHAKTYVVIDVKNPQVEALADVTTHSLSLTTPVGQFHGKRFIAADTKGYLGYRDPMSGRVVRWPLLKPGRLLAKSTSGPWMVSRWQVTAPAAIPSQPLVLAPTIVVNQPVEDVRVVPMPVLAPVEVEFRNTHRHEIVVQLVPSKTSNAKPAEFRIPPGGAIRTIIQRDAGLVRQRVLVGVHGEVQVLAEQVLPPASLYDVVVHECKVTSVYYDRTKRGREIYGDNPVSANKSLVSVGVFQLPAGAQLNQGSTIDVHREARLNRNPGLIRHYPYPGR